MSKLRDEVENWLYDETGIGGIPNKVWTVLESNDLFKQYAKKGKIATLATFAVGAIMLSEGQDKVKRHYVRQSALTRRMHLTWCVAENVLYEELIGRYEGVVEMVRRSGFRLNLFRTAFHVEQGATRIAVTPNWERIRSEWNSLYPEDTFPSVKSIRTAYRRLMRSRGPTLTKEVWCMALEKYLSREFVPQSVSQEPYDPVEGRRVLDEYEKSDRTSLPEEIQQELKKHLAGKIVLENEFLLFIADPNKSPKLIGIPWFPEGRGNADSALQNESNG